MANGQSEETITGGRGRAELFLSVGLLGLLVVFLAPLPTWMLDGLLAFNLASSILVMLVVLGVRKPLDFSVFPSLLLLMTLIRLALNVATTRLILLQGNAGEIVNAFGNFVVGGNLVVGLVIFLILIVIQFVVITRGASRISEVSARFTLDSIPGKQMAIDAEFNAGIIDEKEARRRREELMRSSEFYGTMDGASRFVRGDAIAGLIITAINLFGGIIIGVIKGLPVAQAIKTYSVLTIGDGLITQIPALIISTASGILVTKATSSISLGSELGDQFSLSGGPVRLAALIVLGLALVPGLPTIPFLFLAAVLGLLSIRVNQTVKERELIEKAARAKAEEPPPPTPKTPAEIYAEEFLQMDRFSVDLGTRLVSMLDTKTRAILLEQIAAMRKNVARQMGLWVPSVRLSDNMSLDTEEYRILINGREAARSIIRVGSYLAVDTGSVVIDIPGEPTIEPVIGLNAKWISDADRPRAQLAGYTVVEPLEILVTHLAAVARRHAGELMSRDDLKTLVEKVKQESPAVVEELIPNMLTMGQVHRVVSLLLEERVPVNNLGRILESLAAHAGLIKDPVELVERVRQDIGRAVVDRFRDEKGVVRTIMFEPQLEMTFKEVLKDRTNKMDPERLQKLLDKAMIKVGTEWRKAVLQGRELALISESSMRKTFRMLFAKSVPDLNVISFQEIPSDVLMNADVVIKTQDLQ